MKPLSPKFSFTLLTTPFKTRFTMIFEIIASSSSATESTGNVAVDLANQFGWKPWMFLAQCINFIIVAFVLKKFAFGPIGKVLAERHERIKEGEAKLKKIEQDLADSEKRTAAAIAEANQKSKEMIAEAKESGAKITEEKTQEAISSAQGILAKAEDAAKSERVQMVKELKGEFGKLVATATAAVSGKVLTDTDHKAINEEALSVIEK